MAPPMPFSTSPEQGRLLAARLRGLGLVCSGRLRGLRLIGGGRLRGLGLVRSGRDAEMALDRGQPAVDGRQQVADLTERYAPDARASRPGPGLGGSRIVLGDGQLVYLLADG